MSEQDAAQTTTQADRLVAALSHSLVLASWLGPIGAAVIYALSRDKHRSVAFQAAQAALYQLFVAIVTILSWTCWTGLYMLSLVPIMANPHAYPDPPWFFWAGLASMVLPFALMAVMTVYGLWGALRTLQGRGFRYAVIGKWLERYLQPGQEDG